MSLALPRFRGGLPAARVDHSLRQALAAYDAARQCALLWFHDVLTRELFGDLGYSSMEQYATEALGFSRNRTWQFLRLARDLDRLPPLRDAVQAGRLEWTKAQQVGRVATPATAEIWVEKAATSSRRELAREIKAARLASRDHRAGQAKLALATAGGRAEQAAPAPRIRMSLELDSLDAARLDAMIEAAKKSGSLAATATREEAILAGLESLTGGGDLRRRKSATPYRVVLYRCRDCERSVVVTAAGRRPVAAGNAAAALENAVVHDAGSNHNAIPPAVRQKVLARDGHRCRAPGCRSTRFLELHHVLSRARGGGHHASNLVTVCSRCHRFLHQHPAAVRRLLGPVDAHTETPFNDPEPGGPP